MIDRSGQNTRNLRHHHEDIPWTVARCNRLLRSISSRIATIRRLVENFDNKTSEQRNFSGISQSPVISNVANRSNGLLPYLQSPHAQDPEWMPHRNNATSRTYGNKRQMQKSGLKSTTNEGSASTNSALRTPFLRNLLRPIANASPLNAPALHSIPADPAGTNEKRKSRQLPVKSLTSLSEAQRGLATALCSFLNSTKPADRPARKGARTFREMCLKQVPQYIESEQDWLREEDQDSNANVTDEVYTFLETLGQGETAGFAGLRQVVRSHGLFMITRAVEDGLLRDDIVRELVDACRKCDAIVEGQAILQACTRRTGALGSEISAKSVQVLVESSLSLGSTEFLFRHLARLLADGKMTQSQIIGLEVFWRPLFHTLALAEGRLDAVQFLEAFVLAGGGSIAVNSDTRDLSSFPRSAAVLLTATLWMQEQEARSRRCNSSLAWQLQRMAHSIHQASEEASGLNMARPFVLSALLSTPADNIANGVMTETSAKSLVEMLNKDTQARPREQEEDSEVLLEAAKVISHVDTDLAFAAMKAAVLGLARIASRLSEKLSMGYLKTLAVDGAMNWAEARDDMESYDWAEDVESLFRTDDAALQTMQTPISRKPIKYRWEAGMCEWIQATPFNGVVKQALAESDVSQEIDDSGVCMPSSESPSRKRSRSIADWEEDSDLEDRDELSMQTPELIRLRDQRTRKTCKERSISSEKENFRPMKAQKRTTCQQRVAIAIDDLSDDELGF